MKREGTVAFIKCRKCKEERKFDFQKLSTAWST